MKDLTLNCIDCGNQFVFPIAEREHFQQKGYPNPKRCPNCRLAKKNGNQGASNNAQQHNQRAHQNNMAKSPFGNNNTQQPMMNKNWNKNFGNTISIWDRIFNTYDENYKKLEFTEEQLQDLITKM